MRRRVEVLVLLGLHALGELQVSRGLLRVCRSIMVSGLTHLHKEL